MELKGKINNKRVVWNGSDTGHPDMHKPRPLLRNQMPFAAAHCESDATGCR